MCWGPKNLGALGPAFFSLRSVGGPLNFLLTVGYPSEFGRSRSIEVGVSGGGGPEKNWEHYGALVCDVRVGDVLKARFSPHRLTCLT